MKRTRIPYLTFVFCCCFTLSLAACGQRGPLYLPEETGQTETAADAQEQDGKKAEDDDEETS